MNENDDPTICNCSCHRLNPMVVHYAHCCEPCPLCLHDIRIGQLKHHMEVQHNPDQARVAEIVEIQGVA